jgi:hypothetical protein
VTLAGYSAYAKRSHSAMLAAQASQDFLQPQTSNRAAKSARIETAMAAVKRKPVFALAALGPEISIDRPADPVIASALQIPDAVPMAHAIKAEPAAPAAAVAEPVKPAAIEPAKPAVVAALPPPKPAEKPKHLLPPPPPAPAAQSNVLDDSQISGLKGRLRLTSDQVEYWPAVEAALRDVVRTQLHAAKHSIGARMNIDVNSPEVQKLIWAAMPLLMRLREDQKNEVRKIARVIGLDQVASQI